MVLQLEVFRNAKGVKRIGILHNVIPHEKKIFDNFANKSFLKHNEGFVVLSDAVLKDLLSIRPNAKYLRIDHPVYNHFGKKLKKEEALKKLKLSSNKKQLLFFGFIREYKGLDILLNSLKNLPEDYELIIAGEIYGSFKKYQDIIDSANLNSRVHLFNKYIAHGEVATYFSAADVCILPYKGATQSGITAIAHHFDVPIIATDVGGLKETVEHERTGLIVQPNEKELKEAIELIFIDERLQKFSVAIGASKIENSWNNFAKKVIEFSNRI